MGKASDRKLWLFYENTEQLLALEVAQGLQLIPFRGVIKKKRIKNGIIFYVHIFACVIFGLNVGIVFPRQRLLAKFFLARTSVSFIEDGINFLDIQAKISPGAIQAVKFRWLGFRWHLLDGYALEDGIRQVLIDRYVRAPTGAVDSASQGSGCRLIWVIANRSSWVSKQLVELLSSRCIHEEVKVVVAEHPRMAASSRQACVDDFKRAIANRNIVCGLSFTTVAGVLQNINSKTDLVILARSAASLDFWWMLSLEQQERLFSQTIGVIR